MVHTDVTPNRNSRSSSGSNNNECAELITFYVAFTSNSCVGLGCHFFHIREEETRIHKVTYFAQFKQLVSEGVGIFPPRGWGSTPPSQFFVIYRLNLLLLQL